MALPLFGEPPPTDSLLIVNYSFVTHALETLDIIVPSNVTFVALLTALEDLYSDF
jgi:hypothetical protein